MAKEVELPYANKNLMTSVSILHIINLLNIPTTYIFQILLLLDGTYVIKFIAIIVIPSI